MGNKFPFSFWGVEASSLYSYTALKSLQETQNNCWEAWTNTQSFWNPWITWLSYCGNLLGFFSPQPIPQNSLLSLCTSPVFCPTYCPAFCSSYSAWPVYNWLHIFHSKQARTGWNTIPTSHVAPQHTAGREASYSESQGLTAKATQLRCLDKNSCWATTG